MMAVGRTRCMRLLGRFSAQPYNGYPRRGGLRGGQRVVTGIDLHERDWRGSLNGGAPQVRQTELRVRAAGSSWPRPAVQPDPLRGREDGAPAPEAGPGAGEGTPSGSATGSPRDTVPVPRSAQGQPSATLPQVEVASTACPHPMVVQMPVGVGSGRSRIGKSACGPPAYFAGPGGRIFGVRSRLAARWLVDVITLCDDCRLNFVTVTGQILMAVHSHARPRP